MTKALLCASPSAYQHHLSPRFTEEAEDQRQIHQPKHTATRPHLKPRNPPDSSTALDPAWPLPWASPDPKSGLAWAAVASIRRSQGGTDRAVVGPRLRSVDRPVQAGSTYVDVEGRREGFEQLQQSLWVHIVVIIHVAEPPVGMDMWPVSLERGS